LPPTSQCSPDEAAGLVDDPQPAVRAQSQVAKGHLVGDGWALAAPDAVAVARHQAARAHQPTICRVDHFDTHHVAVLQIAGRSIHVELAPSARLEVQQRTVVAADPGLFIRYQPDDLRPQSRTHDLQVPFAIEAGDRQGIVVVDPIGGKGAGPQLAAGRDIEHLAALFRFRQGRRRLPPPVLEDPEKVGSGIVVCHETGPAQAALHQNARVGTIEVGQGGRPMDRRIVLRAERAN